ncbi:MAG: Methionyl-tRNA synthetase [uncultured Chloroflexia bacterium]|uniref:Methionine--tRNA ligase n=1 Tax=uncultured Chloroflexia bacterium TaxID=1672391 RepID=A0A6J4JMC5_9CHLR|nr:MAG: Methionyl-tRNA synthetase [uncultured Chloroflexia bacterium]
MSENILVSVAWPYANGPFHVGHIAGAYLPADIFARYQRLRGNNVLMVSGSDCHGTPITLEAERQGITPQEVILRNHPSFVNTLKVLGVTFDLFTQTYTENHYRTTTDFFTRLLERGYLYNETMTGSYSESSNRFLPDRYVEGTCPNCGFPRARGDQCDNCGRLHEPWDLIEPRSSLDGGAVTFRETEHYFIDLGKLEPALRAWLDSTNRDYWRSNTLVFTENWLKQGLRGRAITRDLEWGVPVPIDDPAYAAKRIYVWFDAVIGYYSASIEWAERTGQPERWRDWWVCNADGSAPARSYYFLAKDNIPFHTIIWPAILLGYGDRSLAYDVPSNEFLNLEGDKMSTSRNWALWLPDLQDRYQPDQLRYYLTANAPEGRDTNWSWSEFVRRNNDELVATWGNLANRVLTIAHRNFGTVPEPGALSDEDRSLLADVEAGFGSVGALLDAVRLKAGLQEALSIAQRANQYISEQEPWKLVKADRERAATVIYVGLRAIDSINRLLSPFLPFTAQRLHTMLGYDETIAPQPHIEEAIDPDGQTREVLTGAYVVDAGWEPSALSPGQQLRQPEPLFTKLDEHVAEEELARLAASATPQA